MNHLILCPGSRSSPLALAAGGLAQSGNLKIRTAIDERSAAFLGLGISTCTGKATAIITTSGTAVANLLPAAVEADRSCCPLLFITADRPFRLKNCGANQTVNQEDFLKPVCRYFDQGPTGGAHLFLEEDLYSLVEKSWYFSHEYRGPVHLNLPLEEPLHPSFNHQKEVWSGWTPGSFKCKKLIEKVEEKIHQESSEELPVLDPSLPGIVVVGPWRGAPEELIGFKKALQRWYEISGWPVFADPLSGVSEDQPGLVFNWELLISFGIEIPNDDLQILRLGSMPASRTLENWLLGLNGNKLLITEGDSRYLDPLGLSIQWSKGFSLWLNCFFNKKLNLNKAKVNSLDSYIKTMINYDQRIDVWLDRKIHLHGQLNEPALARWIPRLIPSNLPIMLSASSPIRDWITYSGSETFSRRCFGFRGASGIDGTLSLAMGLASANGQLLLVSGDLALLHDSNGWLFANNESFKLIVVLIDNGGGGIFNQFKLQEIEKGDFQQLFKMPQSVDHCALASSYGIQYRQVSCLEDLPVSLEWAIASERSVLIRVCTNSHHDSILRENLRNDLTNYLSYISKNGVIDSF